MTDAENDSQVHSKLERVANAFGATLALVPSIYGGERDRKALPAADSIVLDSIMD